jgi:hypothetical protein
MAKIVQTCPYCVKALPFFNLVRQRITTSETKPIMCPSCGSVISMQGGATIWSSLAIGSTGGYLLGKALGGFSAETALVCVIGGLILFVISSYFTAPIRNA